MPGTKGKYKSGYNLYLRGRNPKRFWPSDLDFFLCHLGGKRFTKSDGVLVECALKGEVSGKRLAFETRIGE